jgi:uncharacterized membrane protein
VTAPGGQEILPGKTQKVVVSVPTRYVKGEYSKDVEVETNDPGMPVLKLTMKMKIAEVLSIAPLDIDFGKVKVGSVNKKMIVITNKGKDPLTLSNITANPSGVLSVSQQGKVRLEPGKSVTVELRYQPSQPDDYFFGLFHVETDLENIKYKDARIRARVARD